MEGMDAYEDLPARRVAMASMRAVESGDRDGWLALFADDALVADPIGPSPLDPTGEGHRGKQRIAAFYDSVICQATVRFVIRESYVAGNECANIGTIRSTFPDGTVSVVDGVYTYRIDESGKLEHVRAYWEFDHMRFESPSG